jgi:hypothetical protein
LVKGKSTYASLCTCTIVHLIIILIIYRDGIHVGHSLLSINGSQVNGQSFNDGNETKDVNIFLNDEANYPVTLKFGRQKLSTNEKIFLGKHLF